MLRQPDCPAVTPYYEHQVIELPEIQMFVTHVAVRDAVSLMDKKLWRSISSRSFGS